MAKIVKQAKADIYLRDTDSQSLFNNSGELSFKYFHEWNDCYNKTTGKTAQIDGETYDESTGTYKPNCPEGYIPVFNGRLSALWDNMVSCFPDRIKSMYVTMRGNGLSYKDMLMKYKEFWRYWCENLYNADAFGYANTGNFDKAFGDKLQMMDFFFQKRQRYLDSKYCCGSSVSNHLRMRLSEVGKGFAIKYYQAIYSSLQWAVGSFATQRNMEPGTYSYMPWKMEGSPQDTTFDIDDADLITELSTYTKTSSGYTITGLEGVGNFKFDSDMGILKRLTKFIMNYTAAKPNTNELGAYFDLSGMTLLKQVIVRNVKNLTKSIVINSDVVEEIDFTNTPIVGITTPPSDSLAKLVLPNTITSLRLKGYTNLQSSGLQIAGYSNIDEFEVEDCPNIDALSLLTVCYNAGAPLSEVTLSGIDWTLDSMDLLMFLAEKKAKLKGKIIISDTVSVSLAQKMQLIAAFGDIDDKGNRLYISYSISEVKKVSIVGKSYLANKGDYTFEAKTLPSAGNNVREFVWSISENDFATISQSGVLALSKIGREDNDDKATISLMVTLSDGSTLEASKEVFFFQKTCELGDYVFSDGTWGSRLADNPLCSPVGVVFYLQPKDSYGKRHHALAVALSDYKQTEVWGLCNESKVGLPGISLNEYTSNVYDIVSIKNYTNYYQLSIKDSIMLDDTDEGVDGFKVYSDSSPMGDIGFVEITSNMYDSQGLGEYLDRIGMKVRDLISAGQLKTLSIIKHRDSILSDSAMDGKTPIPTATETMTEEQSLDQCISNIVNANNSKYAQYYYPAASYCFAYSPKIASKEKLADSLGPNHWFLPSGGELCRLSICIQHGFTNADEFAIFSNAYQEGVFALPVGGTYLSSGEVNGISTWGLIPSTGYGSYSSGRNDATKAVSRYIRPIVAINID